MFEKRIRKTLYFKLFSINCKFDTTDDLVSQKNSFDFTKIPKHTSQSQKTREIVAG